MVGIGLSKQKDKCETRKGEKTDIPRSICVTSRARVVSLASLWTCLSSVEIAR